MIPRLIHQTVPDKAGMHDDFRANVARIKRDNPDFRHSLYEDEDVERYIRDQLGADIYGFYQRINPIYGAARADFFRYLLMYDLGGVYLDIKSTLTRPLNSVLHTDKYHLSHWRNQPGERYENAGIYPQVGVSNEFQQWHIVAPPRHPFLHAVITRVMSNIQNYRAKDFGTGKNGVLLTTGPLAYTRSIQPILHLHPHTLVDIETLGFRYTIYEGSTDLFAHMRRFENHYSDADFEPVVI